MNCFRLLAAALLVCVSGAQCNAQSARTPGVSASEIKIGQTLPLSGPVSAYRDLRAGLCRIFSDDQRTRWDQRTQDQSDHRG